HDYLANSGCLRQPKTINDKDLLVQDILMFQVVHRVTGAFERFMDGLKTLVVLDAITTYPESFKPLMCYEPPPLTAEIMDQLFNISLSSVGKQEGPSKLGKILAFATGATVIPPVGFSPQPSIEFLHEQSIHPSRQLPIANTCINCLKLPMLETSLQRNSGFCIRKHTRFWERINFFLPCMS
uniref:HECT domain-containing protein n=1 Tax=Poecilia reticulata TaxID=8081 RepID=A0A3P9MTD6_POERE